MHVFMHIRVHQNFMNEYVARATVRPHRGYRFTARSFATVTSVSVHISVVYGLSNNMRECAQKAQFSACSVEVLPARGMVRSVSFIKFRRTINSRSRSWVSLTRFINLERATPTSRSEASGSQELESIQQFVRAHWRNVSKQSEEDWSWLLMLFAWGPRLQQTHRCPDGQQRTGREDLDMLTLSCVTSKPNAFSACGLTANT